MTPESVVARFFEANGLEDAVRTLGRKAVDEEGFAKALAVHLNRNECSHVRLSTLQSIIETEHEEKVAKVDLDCSPKAVVARF